MEIEDEAAVRAHIAGLDDRRRAEAERLDAIFRAATGFAPRLWSGRMVGYGVYDYTYETGHSGRFLATGFAAAARHLTIYILPGYTAFPEIMERLGPHRHGKSCIYITRLETTDENALSDLIRAGLKDLGTRWEVQAT